MNRRGFTLVELLIALAILGVLFSILTSFFSSQTRMTRLTQARTEVQDKVRFVSQVLAQDLQLAGASRYVTSSNRVMKLDASIFTPCSSTNYCLTIPTTVNATETKDGLVTRYITSLRSQTSACRQVEYDWSGSTLRRSDVACGASASPTEIAGNLVAVNVRYVCSNSNISNTAIGCLGSDPSNPVAYPRSARVDVYAASDNTISNAAATQFTLGDGTVVSCPANRACFGMSQEVELPNLKDK